jgi:hypothetical protein
LIIIDESKSPIRTSRHPYTCVWFLARTVISGTSFEKPTNFETVEYRLTARPVDKGSLGFNMKVSSFTTTLGAMLMTMPSCSLCGATTENGFGVGVSKSESSSRLLWLVGQYNVSDSFYVVQLPFPQFELNVFHLSHLTIKGSNDSQFQ